MNLIRRYLMVVFVGVALLFGIQVPNFLDQYAKRIDAHLREVSNNLHGYKRVADQHHNQSMHSLIAHYKDSKSPTFRETGFVIEEMFKRKLRFEKDQQAIRGDLFWKVVHVIRDGNPELLQETVEQYSYAVPLNQDAIVSGVVFASIVIFVIELLFELLGATGRKILRRRQMRRNKRLALANREI